MNDVAITSAAAVVHRELLRTLAEQTRTHHLRGSAAQHPAGTAPGRLKPPGTA